MIGGGEHFRYVLTADISETLLYYTFLSSMNVFKHKNIFSIQCLSLVKACKHRFWSKVRVKLWEGLKIVEADWWTFPKKRPKVTH